MMLSADWRNWFKPPEQTIGLSLAALVLVAVVPLLVFGSGAAWFIVDQKKEAVEGELRNTARALQVAVDSELLHQFEPMQMLATDASLDNGSLADFHEKALRVLLINGDWRNIVLIDPKSHTIVESGLPSLKGEVTTSSPSEVEEVVRTRKVKIVGLIPVGKITRQPIIQFLLPVVRAGEVRFILAVVTNPKPLSELFAAQRMPPTWTGAVIDNRMMIAGRSRDPQKFVGVRATPTLASRIAASESGMFTALNQEGATVYTVFSRSPLTDWSVAIGVPAAEVEGPIKRVLVLLGAAGTALMVFSLILTAMVGRAIVVRRNAYEAALSESQSKQKAMLDNDLVGIVTVKDRRMIWANQASEKMLGYGAGVLVGTFTRQNYLSEEDYQAIGAKAYAVLDTGGMFRTRTKLRRKDGSHIWVDLSGQILNKATGESLWTFIDITQQIQAEDLIRQMAFHDALTTLPNRRLFLDRLSQTMNSSKRSGRYAAVMFLDLDNFKPLNDTHGHETGDLLLMEVANRLTRCVRKIDTVARFGGDEFVVMISDLHTDWKESLSQARIIAEKIRFSLSEIYQLAKRHSDGPDVTVTHQCTASIGVAIFMKHDGSSEDIIHWADTAMYQAKDAGRNTIVFHEAEDQP